MLQHAVWGKLESAQIQNIMFVKLLYWSFDVIDNVICNGYSMGKGNLPAISVYAQARGLQTHRLILRKHLLLLLLQFFNVNDMISAIK